MRYLVSAPKIRPIARRPFNAWSLRAMGALKQGVGMGTRKATALLIIGLGLCGLNQLVAQRGIAGNRLASDSCADDNPSSMVTVYAAQARAHNLSLCDGHVLGHIDALRGAQPLSLAAADLDEDGVPDLVSGFAIRQGGTIAIHRGNVHALWPYGPYQNAPPPAFYPDARTFSVPEAPDFLVAGDFDADGHWDVMTAKRGGNALYFLRGDGKGGLLAPRRIPLAGNVTAMIAGEVNRADGLTDIVVGVNTAQGARVLVFESPMGAANAQPEIFSIAQPVTALALGHFFGGAMNDLAIAAGNQIVLVQGRDRELSLDSTHRAGVPPASITAQSFPFAIKALATGDFTGAGPSVAALGDDDQVHILEHTVTETSLEGRALTDPNFQPSIELTKPGKDGKPVIAAATITASRAARLAAIRKLADTASAEWTERSVIRLPSGFSQTSPRLAGARMTGSMLEDLIVPDAGNNQIHVLSTTPHTRGARNPSLNAGSINASPASMELFVSLDAESSPAAVLPMRLNKHGLNGLVLLQGGQTGPVLVAHQVPPANIFTVTNTLDETAPGGTPPAGSLRAALDNVNNAWGVNDAGEYSIVFDIPTSDPGYNPATGTFVIKPISDVLPGESVFWALDPNFATVTIDGYTQPGASPNTLTGGDNAKILIQIDGSSATVAGGVGIFATDSGSVYRGLDFTGWNNPNISTGGSKGGAGMIPQGVGDLIEGNYFGTDPTGKIADANYIGIFVQNGPEYGTGEGNVVGGTTPQARNVISANSGGGGVYFLNAYLAELQGNFIGTDSTGTSLLPNLGGVALNCPTVTIGGTLPGAGNVISGNAADVDLNDQTNQGEAYDSLVQGNLIGTDVTGTLSFNVANQSGVVIAYNADDMTIGGTTPAARNIISGNTIGLYVVNEADFNIVQGNYVGTDITGSKPLGNSDQGYFSGAVAATDIPATENTIGGSVPGAGNVISNNGRDGIEISGASQGPDGGVEFGGSIIEGNYIGTDATGAVAMPNTEDGIYLTLGATNNTIGGNDPGSGNLIAYNGGDGVLIDSGSPAPETGEGVKNFTIANTILSNAGAGVRVNSGSQDLISRNSIFGNGALGINLAGLGPNLNTGCQSTATGPNNSQNAPVLTAGTGTAYITATATDPNNNTSEFSNAVKESTSGDILSLLGSFNSLPSTTYTIEFFSSTAADPSGYGEGQTYLGNTTVTTDASCNVPLNNPVNLKDADMSVTLAETDLNGLQVGPDLGQEYYTATVTNNGVITATNVVFTDPLPSQLEVSSEYCNFSSCQSPITVSLGSCTVSANTVTCNLGSMVPGETASIIIPVQVVAAGSITNTVSVSATQPDPNPANNTASVTKSATYPIIYLFPLNPPAALINNPGGVLLNISGTGLFTDTAVTFNGTTIPVQGILDNQICEQITPCSDLEVQVPASLLTTAGTATIALTNPNPGPGGNPSLPYSEQFTIESACNFTVTAGELNPLSQVTADGTDDYPVDGDVVTDIGTCPWTASSSVPWMTIVEYYPLQFNGYGQYLGGVDINVAPNTGSSSRSGTITIAGQEFPFTQPGGATCDYALNPPSVTIPAAGATGSVAVTATSSSCSYDATPDSLWITIPNGDSVSPTGNAVINYTVAPNTGAPQTGYILVGGEPFQINQQAPSCYFTLSENSANVEVSGGTGSFGVTASSPSCTWTATSSNTSLASVTSGASGTGNGTVSYSVPANTGGAQTPTITIGNPSGGSAVFTVNQASAFACTFVLSQNSLAPPSSTNPSSTEIPATGASGLVTVNASFPSCKWTAASNDPTSIVLNGSVSGTGNGVVDYVVEANPGAPRVLTITAGCVTFTVNQDGSAASNPVPAITTLMPSGTTAGSGAFTLTVNGSGFLNGSVVNFNGNARATTYASASQLRAAILATDVASVGNPPVTVTNPTPGGGTSNSVAFSVTAPAKITPTVTVSPSPSSIITTQALTVTVTVRGGSGNPTPTGAVTVASGSYTSAAVTLSSGSATINIPAGSLATGTDTLTVTYTPDTASSSTYNTAAGSNTVTVTTPAKITPALTVTPSPTGITTTQALSVKVTVSGGSGNPTPTGSVTLTSGSYTSAAATLSSGSATINIPAGSLATGTDTLTASYTPDSASLSTYNSSTGSSTVTVTAATVQVTVGTSPTGLSFSVDGTSYTSTQTLTWTVGASHTIATTSPQTSAGTQNAFASWSDGGAISHSVTAPSSAASYTATFTTSYLLTTAASPSADGTVTPASGSYYASGTAVDLTATANSGFKFATWTGSVAGASSASTTITMTAPESVTANFIVATAPVATLTPALTFTNTEVGTTSSALFATLSNTGNATLNISSIAIGGTNPSDFATTTGANACGTTLAADASCSIYVTFTPASAAGFSATLIVTDNATPTTQSITLMGTGTPAPAPIASLTPATLTFTAVSGTTTASQTATLLNTGNATLNISNITIAGSNPTDFAIATGANACGTTLAADASCSIYVTFTPASTASFSASLQVADNASGSPQSTTLNGTGTPPPSFTISSNSGAQTIQPGGTATYTITVTPQNGAFTNAVALSTTGLPTGAAGIFTPPSVTPGSTSATSMLSIQTGIIMASARHNSAWPLAAPALAIIGLLFLPGNRRRRWITLALLLFASLGAFTALTACGGGFALTQPAQTYTITVTGTSGSDVQSTTVQLTVQ